MSDQEHENQAPTESPAPAAPPPAPLTAGLPVAPPLSERETHLSDQAHEQDKGRPSKVLRSVVGLMVAIAIGFGITYLSAKKESDSAPKVGECAKAVGNDKVKTVSCDDSEAEYEVVRRVNGTTDGESACASDPTVTSYYAFEADKGGVNVKSFVLCMTDH